MDKNNSNNLNPMLNTDLGKFRTYFEPGEEVEGLITSITPANIFLDINAKSEGILDRGEFEENEKISDVKVGDKVKAFFVKSGKGGELLFTLAIKSSAVDDEAIVNAFRGEIPIEGRVKTEKNGGFEVTFGSHNGFCPYSQIDRFPAEDKSIYLGSKFSFLILEYNENNLVVSRRKHLEIQAEKNREQLKNSLQIGDIVEGKVTKIMDFGVFVDLGGVEGLIPMGQLSWSRVNKAEDILKLGEKISVRLMDIQWDKNRLTLSLREAGGDPWGKVQDHYHVSKQYQGKVVKLMPFGAFIELEPGIDGLIHISKLGAGKRINHASEVLKEGETLAVFVESIDLEKRRIGLCLENLKQGRTMDVEGDKLTIGEEITGTVKDIKNFGIFVNLSPKKDGLLHISEISFDGQVNKIRNMHKRFPIGSQLTVTVKDIRQDKISLSFPNKSDEGEDYKEFLAQKSNNNLGSLESAFDGIL